MSDYISREAAIDAIEQMQMPIMRSEFPEEQFVFTGMSEALQAIKDLPSAQPDPSQVARDIATIIENEQDMMVIERNAQQWIPCSERLPDDFEEVNVTWINTDPEPYYDFIKGKPFTGTAVYYKGRWFWYSAVCTDYLREYGFSPNDLMDDSIKVVAWQPIPEPYKEEQE